MGFDYFTIRNLAAELEAKVSGQQVLRASGTAAELNLEMAGGEGLHVALGRDGWVCCSAGRPLDRPDQLGVPEPLLVGARVEKVWADSRDRLLWLWLSRPDSQGQPSFAHFVLELIYPRFQAYLVSERSGRVLRGWAGTGRPRLTIGSQYAAPECGKRLLPGEDTEEDLVAALAGQPCTLRALAGKVVGMDEVVAAVVFAGAGLVPGESLTTEDLRGFWRAARALYRRPAEMGGAVWAVAGKEHFSGLIPATLPAETFASVSEAIRRVRQPSPGGPVAVTANAPGRLRGTLSRLRRRLAALEADLAAAGAADHCQKQAAAILAGITQVPRGADHAQLPDPYGLPGQTLLVQLDPRWSAAENAARLLKAVQRYRRRQEVLPARIRQVRQLVAEGEGILASPTDRDQLEGWLKKNSMNEDREHPRRPAEAVAHPRRYRTSSGWSVWAGRNNVENDLLSHRLAAQNDYWFHAHGYPGSHVVLRREGRKEEPSAQTLREAAGVAAFWSKGKTAKRVSVVYTLVKYVSKPRGGAPGQALLKREKSLMVEPRLLPEEDEGSV
ncbi:MAG: DUF814 domain-containing protein [Candidatus Latescibacteria bacterium]|nr:DUF814 domain-containing protein [Candidatus Latescibacterota bacterium]